MRLVDGRSWRFGLALAALAAAAAADGQNSAPPAGARLYQEYCSVCHGDQGDGRSHAAGSLQPPPADFTRPGLAAVLTPESMLAVVRDGRPGTAMAGWGTQLDATAIAAVVAYVRTAFMSDVAIDAARALYRQECAGCHGDDGNGDALASAAIGRPVPSLEPYVAAGAVMQARFDAILANGRPGTPMSSYAGRLDASRRQSVRQLIVGGGLKAPSATAAARHEPIAAMPRGLRGNPDRGHALYLANCVACHGADGAGDGPRAYFISPRPRNLRSVESRFFLDRARLFYGIRDGKTGTEMPAWGAAFSDQDIADITEYVHAAFITPVAAGPGAAANGDP